MVEIEIGVMRGQCLDRRIGDRAILNIEVAAWQHQRNASGEVHHAEGAPVSWPAPIQTPPMSRNHCDEVLIAPEPGEAGRGPQL
jgi:hypothetical protein